MHGRLRPRRSNFQGLTLVAAGLAWGAVAAAAGNDALDLKGIELLTQGRYRAALKVFDRSLAKDPKNARALANRCTARYKLEDYEGAIADFETATALLPKLKPTLAAQASVAYYRRACARAAQGRSDDAAQDLYASVRLDRKNAPAYAKLGDLAVLGGQHETAIEYFDRALSLDKESDLARAGRARALLALGKPAKALADADAAIMIRPSEAEHRLLRAAVLRALGLGDRALNDERRAAELRRPDSRH
ncbi:MAG: tetratricopeptide repeat protein [Elusimicrobia bacterium]|nr:tetratricopeptide repeat protein [Elusimicrobiota bacterium]